MIHCHWVMQLLFKNDVFPGRCGNILIVACGNIIHSEFPLPCRTCLQICRYYPPWFSVSANESIDISPLGNSISSYVVRIGVLVNYIQMYHIHLVLNSFLVKSQGEEFSLLLFNMGGNKSLILSSRYHLPFYIKIHTIYGFRFFI